MKTKQITTQNRPTHPKERLVFDLVFAVAPVFGIRSIAEPQFDLAAKSVRELLRGSLGAGKQIDWEKMSVKEITEKLDSIAASFEQVETDGDEI